MRKKMFLSMAALTLACCECGVVAGQIVYQTGQFGYRTYGQTLTPPRSMFLGGVPSTATMRFQMPGQSNVWNGLATPWRRSYQSAIDPSYLTLPPPQLTLQPQSPDWISPASQWAFQPQPQYGISPASQWMFQPQYGIAATWPGAVAQMPGVDVGPTATMPPPGYNPAAPPPMQATGITSVAATGAAWNYTTSRVANRMVSPPAESYMRSAELSARLTRIARTRGMLAGPAINVYLSGDVALVRGVVRSSADRTVLRNVLGLEPNVSRIDDRLVVRRN